MRELTESYSSKRPDINHAISRALHDAMSQRCFLILGERSWGRLRNGIKRRRHYLKGFGGEGMSMGLEGHLLQLDLHRVSAG
jgi:hypothetical protein